MNKEGKAALVALMAICPTHTVDGKAQLDRDCAACQTRLRCSQLYLLGMIADVEDSVMRGVK